MMNCLICNNDAYLIFEGKILNKYNVGYFKCKNCGFIQTERPGYWLDEAYSSAISTLDVGLLQRNFNLSSKTEKIIKSNFDFKARFLDYGGGFGLFVRLMRDKGFDFYRQDLYCENIFAKYWDVKFLSGEVKFQLLTAFEVFEHLIEPYEEIENMFKYSDSVLFSTELLPDDISNLNDWWYFVPEGGQHISFFTLESLKVLAEKFNCYLHSNNQNLHLFTKNNFKSDLFSTKNRNTLDIIKDKFQKIFNTKDEKTVLESLLEKDFEFAKKNAFIKN